MHSIHLTTDTAANAKLLAAFLASVKYVKSVTIDPPVKEEYNWINPSRLATDEEIEQMLDECEKSPLLTSKEARELTRKKLKEWRAKK